MDNFYVAWSLIGVAGISLAVTIVINVVYFFRDQCFPSKECIKCEHECHAWESCSHECTPEEIKRLRQIRQKLEHEDKQPLLDRKEEDPDTCQDCNHVHKGACTKTTAEQRTTGYEPETYMDRVVVAQRDVTYEENEVVGYDDISYEETRYEKVKSGTKEETYDAAEYYSEMVTVKEPYYDYEDRPEPYTEYISTQQQRTVPKSVWNGKQFVTVNTTEYYMERRPVYMTKTVRHKVMKYRDVSRKEPRSRLVTKTRIVDNYIDVPITETKIRQVPKYQRVMKTRKEPVYDMVQKTRQKPIVVSVDVPCECKSYVPKTFECICKQCKCIRCSWYCERKASRKTTRVFRILLVTGYSSTVILAIPILIGVFYPW